MQKIRIGLMGFGTVGGGVWRILNENREKIQENSGYDLEIKKILVRDITKKRDESLDRSILTDNPEDILNDKEIDIVIEVMGGIQPAKDYITRAMENKKHVVTANKALLATHGGELIKLSQKENVLLYYEASVAGGVPIIHAIKESLTANKIESILGILNGTTNYILTKMSEENLDYETALKEAQRLGYAEADPTSDVEGYDASYKLAILAGLAFGADLKGENVYREGISNITSQDIEYARELGFSIKLLAIAKEANGEIELKVHPTFIPLNHPLASVGDAYNAVYVTGNAVEELMFYGKGAGGLPTGSAIVGDIISIVRKIDQGSPSYHRIANGRTVKPMSENEAEYYVRLIVKDYPGVLGRIASLFGKHNVSLSSVIQKGRGEPMVSLVFITHTSLEKDVQSAIEEIKTVPGMAAVANIIRVEKI
jgi:homoserine dehydrogenase